MECIITVIIPVYNTEPYLQFCLDSLRAQTEGRFEAILVDDGSTDQSGAICDRYEALDRRFRVVHQENRGVSAARNAALESVRGRYLCFLDADDYLPPHYLESLLGMMGDCVLAACGSTQDHPAPQITKVKEMTLSQAKCSLFDSRKGIKGYSGGKLYCSRYASGVRFDEGQKYAEDMLFNLDYLNACPPGGRVRLSDDRLYCYRKHSSSALQRMLCDKIFDPAWCQLVEAADKAMNRAQEKKLRHAITMERVTQCVTLMRAMSRCNSTRLPVYKDYRRFVRRHLPAYLLWGHYSLKKRLGTVAVLLMPGLKL